MKKCASGLLAAIVTSGAIFSFVACGADDGTGNVLGEPDGSSSSTSSPDAAKGDAAPATYSVKVNIVGLEGTGLVLQNNGASDLPVAPSSNSTTTTVSIASSVPGGTAYDVTVKDHPATPPQNCAVAGGKGTVVAGDVESITVDCSTAYTIGGTVSGLAGKDLILQNDGGGAVETVKMNANGLFAFPKPLLPGAMYSVQVKQNPTDKWQTCTISRGGAGAGAGSVVGNVGNANVTDLAVTCTTNEYSVSVSVSGVAGGGLVFQNNLADDLAVPANAKYTFTTSLESGAGYSVTQSAPPTNPWQSCVVTNPTGKVAGADLTLNATCTTNKYKLEGTLAELQGNGLVLTNNGGDDLTLNAANNGTFTFVTSVASKASYAVAVKTQPTGVANEKCSVTVATASGTVTNADVTNVSVTCASQKRIFASSQVYSANLGGLAGADAKCQGLATAANLPGNYKAWLSDATASAAARLTHATVPYRLVNGTLIADDWNDLTDGTLAAPIDKTETGGAVPLGNTACVSLADPPRQSVWTDTNASGTLALVNHSCSNWTATTGSTVFGDSAQASSLWTAWCISAGCGGTSAIYCIQQ